MSLFEQLKVIFLKLRVVGQDRHTPPLGPIRGSSWVGAFTHRHFFFISSLGNSGFQPCTGVWSGVFFVISFIFLYLLASWLSFLLCLIFFPCFSYFVFFAFFLPYFVSFFPVTPHILFFSSVLPFLTYLLLFSLFLVSSFFHPFPTSSPYFPSSLPPPLPSTTIQPTTTSNTLPHPSRKIPLYLSYYLHHRTPPPLSTSYMTF